MKPLITLGMLLLATSLPALAADLPAGSLHPATSLATTLPAQDPFANATADKLAEITQGPAIKHRDLASDSGDIWTRIRHGFGMSDLESAQVTQRERWYTARPQALVTMFERGGKYLFHIVESLEARGMPSELALLPLVESAYNPMALSSAKAAGLWQFIPSTGKNYKLEQNWWVDERRDVLASTDAALAYLQTIYEMQGDWHLALASYNWGENAVARAVDRNEAAGKAGDYASLKMPRETRDYVPKLQALKNIISHPERYGITLPAIPNAPYFVSVPRAQAMDVAVAARLAELPLDEFRELNPAFNRPVIPGSSPAPLLLPIENARLFETNLANHGRPLLSWRTYSIPGAEIIEKLAQRLRLSAETLRHANGLKPRAKLPAGYTLLIPASVDEALLRYSPAKSAPAKNRSKPGVRLSERQSSRGG